MMHTPQRGFTLLVAVILTSVLVSVGLALLDIAYKQIVLSSTAKQSQTAFYAADSALECALYWDQQHIAFSYGAAVSSVTCSGQTLAVSSPTIANGIQKTSFSISYANGSAAYVEIYKGNGSTSCNTSGKTTCIYANGYNAASTDPRRIERGLKVVY